MNAWAVLKKNLLEQARDPLGLALTLLTTPALVLFFWIVFQKDAELTVALVDAPPSPCASALAANAPVAAETPPRDDVVERLRAAPAPRGLRLRLETVASAEEAHAALRRGTALAAAELVLERGDDGACHLRLQTAVRRSDARALAAVMLLEGAVLGREPPSFEVWPRGGAGTALDDALPPVLAFAAIMLVFSTALAIAREVEAGTLLRLRLTRLSPSAFLLGVASAQALLGAAGMLLAFATAAAVGVSLAGSYTGALLGVATAATGCVGLGLVVGSRAGTVHRAFLVSSFVMLLLLLFSGVVFPLPSFGVSVLGVDVEPFDLLPTRHAVAALRACAQGATFVDVSGRLVVAALESAALFVLGTALFRRTFLAEP